MSINAKKFSEDWVKIELIRLNGKIDARRNVDEKVYRNK